MSGQKPDWRGAVNKDLQRMGLALEETQAAAVNRQEWRRTVAQCVCMPDAGYIKVKIKQYRINHCAGCTMGRPPPPAPP